MFYVCLLWTTARSVYGFMLLEYILVSLASGHSWKDVSPLGSIHCSKTCKYLSAFSQMCRSSIHPQWWTPPHLYIRKIQPVCDVLLICNHVTDLLPGNLLTSSWNVPFSILQLFRYSFLDMQVGIKFKLYDTISPFQCFTRHQVWFYFLHGMPTFFFKYINAYFEAWEKVLFHISS